MFSQGENMPVGLVAHILGWNKEGVAVLELFDTVALKLFFADNFIIMHSR